jgi:RNA polymerase sigma factor (sigma-70 family)
LTEIVTLDVRTAMNPSLQVPSRSESSPPTQKPAKEASLSFAALEVNSSSDRAVIRARQLLSEDYAGYLATIPSSALIFSVRENSEINFKENDAPVLSVREECMLFARFQQYRAATVDSLFRVLKPEAFRTLQDRVELNCGIDAAAQKREKKAILQVQKLYIFWRDILRSNAVEERGEKINRFMEKHTQTTRVFMTLCKTTLHETGFLEHTRREKISRIHASFTKLQEVRDVLCIGNLRLAWRIAAKYIFARGCYEYQKDIISASERGLLTAIDRFNPLRKNKFSTYATWWCRSGCSKEFNQLHTRMKSSHYSSEKARTLRQAEKKLLTRCDDTSILSDPHRTRTYLASRIHALATAVGTSTSEVRRLWYARERQVLSLSASIGDGEAELQDFICDENAIDMDFALGRKELSIVVGNAILQLPEKQAAVIKAYFGIGGSEPQILDDIGKSIRYTKEGVRQLKLRALRTLYEICFRELAGHGVLKSLGLTFERSKDACEKKK